MPTQIVLAWDVDCSNTPFGPVQVAAALQAVPLYESAGNDPVLGQLFGLTVASDAVTAPNVTTSRRTITLNMTPSAGFPFAPPVFQCHPDRSTPQEPSYVLRRSITLPGEIFIGQGATAALTTETLLPSLSAGDTVQFMSQQGVFYVIQSLTSSSIVLTTAFTGPTGTTTASKEVPAPVTRVAMYSSSDHDTNGVATSPAIPAGTGARTVSLTYRDTTGTQFTSTVLLAGKRPAPLTLAGGSLNIASISAMHILSTGAFENSVGQITLAELTDDLPPINSNRTPEDFIALTDEAQLLIGDKLTYLPTSFFALAQQSGAATGTPPADEALGALLAEYTNPQTAAPPPNPSAPVANYLSGLFTRTLQLALVTPITPQAIAYA